MQFNQCIMFVILTVLMYIAYRYQLMMYKIDADFDRFEKIECDLYKNKLLEEFKTQDLADLTYQKNAYSTWFDHYRTNKGKSKFVGGSLGCFCEDKFAELGATATAFRYFRKDGVENSKIMNEDEYHEKVQKNQICYQYVLEFKFSTYFHTILAVTIIIINAIFFAIIEPLVDRIGYHRRTMMVMVKTQMIVICYILDMWLLPILIGLNLKEYGFEEFTGKFTDFSEQWYIHVGQQIFTTMLIFSFQPLIDFITEYLGIKIPQMLCKKSSDCEDFNCDQLTYLNENSGPEYFFYYKAAITKLSISVILLMGSCMPAFYLLGIIALAC